MENKNTNTTTEATTTTTEATKGKKGEKEMDTMKKSLIENLSDAKKEMEKNRVKVANVMNHGAREKRGIASRKITEAIEVLNKSISAVNTLSALDYYKDNTLVDILKAGQAVPAFRSEVTEEEGVFIVSVVEEKVYPTMAGLVSAGLIKKDTMDTVDLLRRVSAALKGDTLALTGDIENKKDIPSKSVASLIEAQGELSITKATKIMSIALKELTGGAFKKDVFPKVYKDFAEQVTKRGKEWGTRTHIGKATANDMILEYVHMGLTGKNSFRFTID